ncbi:MAG TPA: hypothetical protein VJT15_10795 [Pyrinomonadaceae bacterium]|nr:hypothetical protein [Pyrinomonadaceae bacterium]
MKKPIFAALIIALLLGAGTAQDKPWSEWTRIEAEKILNNSAWGQTQTDTDTSEMMYSPTSQTGLSSSTRSGVLGNQTDRQSVNSNRVAQGANNQAISVNYHVRLLSAKPVRQAFMRVIELTQKTPDKELIDGLRSFVERDFGEFIVVAVTFDSTDGRFSGPALQAFSSATIGTLKNKTYLERKDGKRVFLKQYHAPINDGLGAKFIFPRVVDEKKFVNAETGSFRFFSEVTNQLKLNVTFKTSDLMYKGQLEY